jgi:prolyl-tRNA synthetase
MKLTNTIWQTLKEVPKEAEIASHQLLLRAGLVHKSVSGIFSYLPFAVRTIRKIEKIIREELESIDVQEIIMSVMTPSDLWKESGRWDDYGPLMLRAQDRGERFLCFSPTNEEAVTDIFRKTVSSYKSLPQAVYQINTKFRDEIRPRFGMLRGREFTMKDAYSFHLDKPCLDQFYDEMYKAYFSIFTRLELEFMVVEADAGDMGDSGSKTHEFQILAASGEDELVYTEGGEFAANIEKAQTVRGEKDYDYKEQKVVEVETPNMPTISQVSESLGKNTHHTLKVLVYKTIKKDREDFVLCVLLGDDDLNELKLKNYLGPDHLSMATDTEIEQLKLTKGYIGPQDNFHIQTLVDNAVDENAFFVVGANKKNYHITGFKLNDHAGKFEKIDLRISKMGDLDVKSGSPINIKKGIEVGHIFQLGAKYTKALDASVLDQNGKKLYPFMGCYGIGVTRVFQAAIEQNHDDKGIVWPKAIAPFQVYLLEIGKSEEFKTSVDELYKMLKGQNLEVVYDNRKLSPGAKFKDAELLGIPIILVAGEKNASKEESLEVIVRKTGEKVSMSKGNAIKFIQQFWNEK